MLIHMYLSFLTSSWSLAFDIIKSKDYVSQYLIISCFLFHCNCIFFLYFIVHFISIRLKAVIAATDIAITCFFINLFLQISKTYRAIIAFGKNKRNLIIGRYIQNSELLIHGWFFGNFSALFYQLFFIIIIYTNKVLGALLC